MRRASGPFVVSAVGSPPSQGAPCAELAGPSHAEPAAAVRPSRCPSTAAPAWSTRSRRTCCGASCPIYFLSLVTGERVRDRGLARAVLAGVLRDPAHGHAQVAARSAPCCATSASCSRWALAGALIYVNWQTYVLATLIGSRGRGGARVLHQSDRHRVPRRARAAREAAGRAVGGGRRQRRSR